MRAWIISDIHHARMDVFWSDDLVVPDADICICAGDITNNIADSINYVRRFIETRMPVILVLGNHDYYGSSIDFAFERARRLIQGTRIHLLENGSIEIEGRRFIGATLWTDYAVPVGGDEHIPPEERRVKAFGLAPWRIADFHYIYRSDERRPSENGMVTVQEIVERHKESRKFIDRELSEPFSGLTIVVTHHAPLIDSFDPRFFGEVTNAAFASDLSDLITRRKPTAWVHGHIHKFRDYMFEKTRIMCNPIGYASGQRGFPGFIPGYVVDF